MFREQILPLTSDAEMLSEVFIQRPTRIPVTVPLFPTQRIIREAPDYTPLAIVAVVSFLAFLGFLAYMRQGR